MITLSIVPTGTAFTCPSDDPVMIIIDKTVVIMYSNDSTHRVVVTLASYCSGQCTPLKYSLYTVRSLTSRLNRTPNVTGLSADRV